MVIHHLPGWDEATKEITRNFAHHGYAAISPNLHFREGKGTPEENSGHSFFTVDRPAYRVEAAMQGWKRVFQWFGKYLR